MTRAWLIYTATPVLRALGFETSRERAEELIARRLAQARAKARQDATTDLASTTWYSNAKVAEVNLED